jgi:hypothetical protein
MRDFTKATDARINLTYRTRIQRLVRETIGFSRV